jgi:isoleucyl-tRNA synthetase
MEAQMDALVEAVQLGRACRAQANMKTRQPAAKLYVKGASFGEDYQALCEDELNVKAVVFTDDTRDYTTYQLKPQMRTLGRKYGKLLGAIGQKLASMDGNDVVDTFARGEIVSFELDGTLALTVEGGEADETYTSQEWKINDQKAVVAIRVAK